jgi:hypothetical protein
MAVAILIAPVVNACHAEEVVPAIVVNDLIGGAVDDYEAIGLSVGNPWILHCDGDQGRRKQRESETESDERRLHSGIPSLGCVCPPFCGRLDLPLCLTKILVQLPKRLVEASKILGA